MDLEVQRYLVECIESLRFLRSQYGAGHENVRESLASAGGVLSAFRVSKAVSDAEFDDWIWRAGEAAGLILPPRDAPRTGMHAAAFAEDPPKPGQPPVTRPPTPAPVQWDSYARFIRMLPGPDNELVIAGGHFRVLGLELYDTRMRFHWRIAPPHDVHELYAEDARAHARDTEGLPDAEREQLLARWRGHQQGRIWQELTVTDDVGTAYRHLDGGSSGFESDVLGNQVIAPAPPVEASVVTIHLRGANFEIRLVGS